MPLTIPAQQSNAALAQSIALMAENTPRMQGAVNISYSESKHGPNARESSSFPKHDVSADDATPATRIDARAAEHPNTDPLTFLAPHP